MILFDFYAVDPTTYLVSLGPDELYLSQDVNISSLLYCHANFVSYAGIK